MKYFSTGKNSASVSFKEALLQGLAPDEVYIYRKVFQKPTVQFLKKILFKIWLLKWLNY